MPGSFRHDNKGFTLVEMLVVITIIGILAAMAVPNYLKAKNKAKEAECKANLHVIQTALERYSVDHNGIYPPYLIGGDKAGWMRWHRLYDSVYQNAAYLQDPLVEYSYMDGYPKNPFVSDGAEIVMLTNGGSTIAGTGDPRFGQSGTAIGNVVEDPRYYRQDNPADMREPVIETYLTLPPGGLGNFSDVYHYEMGGHLDSAGNVHRLSWIGQFFYRATNDVKIGRTGGLDGVVKVPDLGFTKSNVYYILGTFGSSDTRGMDVIRLINTNSNGQQINYRTPPEAGLSLPVGRYLVDGYGIPEVFGHGDRNTGPVWPYKYDIDDKNIDEMRFGAPDGIEDGVVLVLTSGGSTQNF